MRVIKPPQPGFSVGPDEVILFAAGSIENGIADNWQARLEKALARFKRLVILNPRQDQWDASCTPNDPRVEKQIEWELDGIELSDIVVVYLDPNTKSAISLMELGIVSVASRKKVFVCCPENFWRYMNVKTVCKRFGIRLFNNEADWLKSIIEYINEM